MVFTETELKDWKVEDLRKFLTERGVPLNAGCCRKVQLIEKVVFAQKLKLPVLSSNKQRITEIVEESNNKLMIDGVKLPHPSTIKVNWLERSQFLPSIMITNITDYATICQAFKA